MFLLYIYTFCITLCFLLCGPDKVFLHEKLYSIDMDKETEETAMVKFYELTARPVQGVCR